MSRLEVVEKIEHKGKTIEIMPDFDPMSPREWDNLGTILYTSTRYHLGDKRVDREVIEEIVNSDDYITLPVYAYIHSGTVLNTTGFSCPWDSGQCGIIYVEKAKALKEWGKKRLTAALRKKIEDCLRGEVGAFSQYLSGEVYGYRILDKDGNEQDSCWGFHGLDYCIESAKEAC